MSWLSGALQKVQARSDNWKDRARDTVRNIASRTQHLEEVLAGNLQHFQGVSKITAQDLEAQLEAEARGLSRLGPATETVQRWLLQLRSPNPPRYAEAPREPAPGAAPEGEPRRLTFHQVFLRGRILELALDSASRAPELRVALRTYALPTPEAWPDEKTPPVAFAHALTLLLCTTIGPPELWLALLGALLSSEKGPADEPCHAWLLQLMVGLRHAWQDADAEDREREVEAVEQVAQEGLAAAEQVEVAPSRSSLALMLPALAQKSSAVERAHRAWSLRHVLANDLAEASARHSELVHQRTEAAAAVASVAAERVVVLDAEARKLHFSTEELKKSLSLQAEDLKSQLSASEPTVQQLEREIEEVELTQRELLRQVGQLSEKLEVLRKRREEHIKLEDGLHAELRQLDSICTAKISAEDQVHCRTEGARALAVTVVDLANSLASPGKADAAAAQARSAAAASIAEDAERCRQRSEASALDLASREVARLRLVSRAVDVCIEVAEERERSREAMEKLGVPVATLESDVVGEAEIEQSLQDALAEVTRGGHDSEELQQALRTCAERSAAGEEGSKDPVAAKALELAEALGTALEECASRRERLKALLPPPVEESTTPAGSGTGSATGGSPSDATLSQADGHVDGTVASFLQEEGTEDQRQKLGNRLGGLLENLPFGRGRMNQDARGRKNSGEDLDPFMLADCGAEADDEGQRGLSSKRPEPAQPAVPQPAVPHSALQPTAAARQQPAGSGGYPAAAPSAAVASGAERQEVSAAPAPAQPPPPTPQSQQPAPAQQEPQQPSPPPRQPPAVQQEPPPRPPEQQPQQTPQPQPPSQLHPPLPQREPPPPQQPSRPQPPPPQQPPSPKAAAAPEVVDEEPGEPPQLPTPPPPPPM